MSETFDTVGEQFLSYYDTVRGHVRERLTRNNVTTFMPASSMEVLDVGGGDARDAIWLAEQGHKVEVIDPSIVMVEKARKAVAAAKLGQLITIKHGDPEDVLGQADIKYDMVLSHGVLMYVDNPQAHLNLLSQSVKPGGVVSVLTKGKAGSLLRLLHKHDYKAADNLQRTDRLVNNLGKNVLAVDDLSLAPMLVGAHLNIVEEFGVRIASEFDYRAVADIDQQELASILAIEGDLGSGPTTKGMGQMLQFICKPIGEKQC